ncbi:hypothetical protein CEXT_676881 [Caerostris extrusa]|uniref:Uncharacterized protein n=1 Tax=Caerostris extrusa TaxID=172846 RepID=A0AAV4V9E4_CAEEX|nr:hypothetical protein CEXT_676881 [Caerostris extrusa]
MNLFPQKRTNISSSCSQAEVVLSATPRPVRARRQFDGQPTQMNLFRQKRTNISSSCRQAEGILSVTPLDLQSETTVVADSHSLRNRLIKYLPGVTCVPLCSWPALISISQQR